MQQLAPENAAFPVDGHYLYHARALPEHLRSSKNNRISPEYDMQPALHDRHRNLVGSLPNVQKGPCFMMHQREKDLASAIYSLSHLFVIWDLFGELLGLVLRLLAELLGLDEGGIGALLSLVGSLVKLVLDGGKTVLGLELESLLTATHAVEKLVDMIP